MEISQPRLRSLLRQAAKVEESGKRAAAEQLYQQILAEAPETEAALMGLAHVTYDDAQKETCYEKALSLNPDNIEAQISLAELRGENLSTTLVQAWEREKELAAAAKKEEEEQAKQLQMEKEAPDKDSADFELFCYRHPGQSTSLRCYNCDKPICMSCANKTSVGYLCPDCLRDLEDKYFTAKVTDYLLATAVALPLSLIAGVIVWRLSGGFFMIFLMIFAGGFVGSIIGRLTKKAIGGRRGRYLPELVVGLMILGVLIPALPIFLVLLVSGPAGLAAGAGLMFTFITPGVYLFVAGGSAYYWMK
ncbi:MAG: hypothetical protein GY796_04515 [Chloroflexi bacterium]|nr:hypothetical protein [Chloroflexota bacterium]